MKELKTWYQRLSFGKKLLLQFTFFMFAFGIAWWLSDIVWPGDEQPMPARKWALKTLVYGFCYTLICNISHIWLASKNLIRKLLVEKY
jgi:hypothetical protein